MLPAPAEPEPGSLIQLSPGHRVGPCLGRSTTPDEFIAKGLNITIRVTDYPDNGILKTLFGIDLRDMTSRSDLRLGLSFSYDVTIDDVENIDPVRF